MTSCISNEQIINLIKQECVPALGCTEPVSVALASAKCREVLGKIPQKLEIEVSGNIFKNGMGVGIPGTGMKGLHIAAALGCIGGKSDDKLEVLKHISPEQLEAGKKMLEEKRVDINIKSDAVDSLFVEVKAIDGDNVAIAQIVHRHINFTLVKSNDEILLENKFFPEKLEDKKKLPLTVEKIVEFVNNVPYEDIKFILDGARLNDSISKVGLNSEYGLGIGRTMIKNIDKGLLKDDLLNNIILRTTAASDARMGGSPDPVMTNSGSGNQGITTFMPVVVTADYLRVTDEKLARALVLSNLIAIHIHSFMNHLSAFCAVVVAATGAGCGIAYLKGGGIKEYELTIKNMAGNIVGMICDGAKLGCALKVNSGITAAFHSAMLALEGIEVGNDGIVENDLEKTIKNIGDMTLEGMVETDKFILKTMVCK